MVNIIAAVGETIADAIARSRKHISFHGYCIVIGNQTGTKNRIVRVSSVLH